MFNFTSQMKKTVLILTILLLTTTITTIQPVKSEETTQNYYIAKNGNDNNPGTEEKPWLTLNKAGQTATAGDTVYVKQGIYNEQLNIKNSGNENNYITFSAYSTDEVIIDGTNIPLNWNGLIRLDNIGYVKISGFKIQNSEYFGIYCKNACNNLILQNNEITNCQSSGIIIYPSSSGNPHHLYIYNNTIDTVCMNMNQEALSLSKVNVFEITNNKIFNSYKEGIDVKNGCSNGIIQENEVSNHDTMRPCIYVDAYGENSYNIIIQKNTAYDNGQGICLATEEGGTLENITICNNIIYTKNNGFGIHKFTTPGSHQKKDIYVINNLFHMAADGTCIVLTDNEEHFSNLIIRNNILSGTDYHMITTSFQEYLTIQIDHNLFTSTSNYYGENYVIGNPEFNDTTTNNFQLQTNSPAIDNGNPQLAPSHDYNNIPRPQGKQIDIGPYEYQEKTITPSNEHPTATLVSPSQNRTANVFLPASLKVTVNDNEKQVINVTFYNANNQSIIGTDRVIGDNEIASIYWTDLTLNTTYRWYVTVDDGSSIIREPEEPYGYWEFTTIKNPTIPITPTDFLANAEGRFQINLTWSKEENADCTYIEYHTIKDDSWEIGDHQFLYNNTGNSTILDGLNPDVQRYFKAWSWNKTANIFSPVGIMNNAITESNNVPFYSNEYPMNNTIVQDLTLVWNLTITDFDRDDVLHWTIECENYKVGKNDDTSGSKSLLLPKLNYNGKYVIWVNSSDAYDITSEWFCFFTAEDNISIVPPEPSPNGQQPPAFIPIEQTEKNNPPSDQILITGPSIIELGVMYGYHCHTFDIDNDTIQYRFDWGDGTYSEWSEYVTSNNSALMNHSWYEKPFDNISVLAQDEHGLQTNWSEPFIITINQPPTFQNITFTMGIEKEIIFNDAVILNISVNQTMMFTPNDLFDINESNYLSFNWDFGDGTKKNGTQITHVYNKTGEYIVNLSVIDQKGNEHHFKKRIVVNAGSNISNLDISPKKQDISKTILIFIFLIITSLVTMIILFIFRRKIFFNSIKTSHKPYYQNFNTKSKQDKNLVSKTINNNVMTKRPLFIMSTLNQNDNAYDKNMSTFSINSKVSTTNINKSTDTVTEEISIHHKIEEKNILSYKDSILQNKTYESSHTSSEENIDILVDELINSKKKI